VKRLVLVLMMISLWGCVYVEKEAAAIRKRNAEESAAIQKMRVTASDRVPGHPNYTELGKVQGYCLADTPEVVTQASGRSLKEAAYEKYGNRVNAIVGVRSWFIPSDDSMTAADDPLDPVGYFQCEGMAVSYQK